MGINPTITGPTSVAGTETSPQFVLLTPHEEAVRKQKAALARIQSDFLKEVIPSLPYFPYLQNTQVMEARGQLYDAIGGHTESGSGDIGQLKSVNSTRGIGILLNQMPVSSDLPVEVNDIISKLFGNSLPEREIQGIARSLAESGPIPLALAPVCAYLKRVFHNVNNFVFYRLGEPLPYPASAMEAAVGVNQTNVNADKAMNEVRQQSDGIPVYLIFGEQGENAAMALDYVRGMGIPLLTVEQSFTSAAKFRIDITSLSANHSPAGK